jgi:hypothetical protein
MKTKKCTVQFIAAGIVFCSSAVYAQQANAKSQNAENRIKNFFAGFEKKDWNLLADQVSDGFNFTRPNNDDHSNLTQYKEKCWPTGSKYYQHIEFAKIVVDGSTAFAMYNVTSTDNKLVHNVEYYTFSNGKIKSIETFFGIGVHYQAIQAM